MVVFKHSGHAGDVIYALPAMIAAALPNERFTLLLKLYETLGNEGTVNHPLGKFMLNEAYYLSLKALFEKQPYIEKVDIYTDQPIDIDLDTFRNLRFVTAGNISRWYESVCDIRLDLSKPWLWVKPREGFEKMIIAARSMRHRNKAIHYRTLNRYEFVGFVGTVGEYQDFRLVVPHAQYVKTNDFYELATIIAGCKLFVGNQSAPFAIAEGLKAPRLLEVYPEASNVIPCNGGYAASLQNHFDEMLENLAR